MKSCDPCYGVLLHVGLLLRLFHPFALLSTIEPSVNVTENMVLPFFLSRGLSGDSERMENHRTRKGEGQGHNSMTPKLLNTAGNRKMSKRVNRQQSQCHAAKERACDYALSNQYIIHQQRITF